VPDLEQRADFGMLVLEMALEMVLEMVLVRH